jgi:hypothetical protein
MLIEELRKLWLISKALKADQRRVEKLIRRYEILTDNNQYDESQEIKTSIRILTRGATERESPLEWSPTKERGHSGQLIHQFDGYTFEYGEARNWVTTCGREADDRGLEMFGPIDRVTCRKCLHLIRRDGDMALERENALNRERAHSKVTRGRNETR